MSAPSHRYSSPEKYPFLLSSKQEKTSSRGVQTNLYKDSHSSSEFTRESKKSQEQNLNKDNNNPSNTPLKQIPSYKAKQSRTGRDNIRAQFSTILGPEQEHKALAEKNASCFSYKDDETESSDSFPRAKPLPTQLREKWRLTVLGVGFTAVIMTIAFTVLLFLESTGLRSSSVLGLVTDIVSCVVLYSAMLWRFRDTEGKSHTREDPVLGVAVVTFIFLGAGTCVKAIMFLYFHHYSVKSTTIFIMLAMQALILGCLAFALHNLSRKLNSFVVRLNCYGVFINVARAMVALATGLVYRYSHPDMWFFEHVLTLGIGIATDVFGVTVFVKLIGKEKRQL